MAVLTLINIELLIKFKTRFYFHLIQHINFKNLFFYKYQFYLSINLNFNILIIIYKNYHIFKIHSLL